jgi:xanthine dehydrogenase/oxidase
MLITEQMVSEVADQLGMSVNELRFKNMYKEDQRTPCDFPIEDWHVPEMWQQVLQDSEFEKQRDEIAEFNAVNNWKKRGIAIIPTKFPLGLPNMLNQATALVHIHTDGSVLVTHGGIEMGQGLHTKITQIAANALHVPPSQVYISGSSSDRIINTSPSGGSFTTDLNGMAVANACTELYERLAPFREASPDGTLADWAQAAYASRVNLSAQSFYTSEELTYDPKSNTGRMWFYFTSGVAVSSVELDLMTGEHTVLRADLSMDIGQSINPAIDVGQIEGGFMQGVGWCTSEELKVRVEDGSLLARGPRTYNVIFVYGLNYYLL